jgi:dolichol-phosphate mannosyltransferase
MLARPALALDCLVLGCEPRKLPAVRVLVIVPTYNEIDNIDRVIAEVGRALPDAGIMIVDDGSPDGTADSVEALQATVADLHILRRSSKSGLGSAYRTGFAWGLEHGYEVMVEMDADLSHDPGALPGLIAPIAEGHELSIGSRYVPGGSIPNWKLHRHLLSRGGNLYASAVLGLGVADSTAGFRAYSSTVLSRIALDKVRAEGYGFQIEMTYRAKQAGASIVEVPIRFVDRELGESKMSSIIVVEALGLVTWWGARRAVSVLGRLARGRRAPSSRVPVPPVCHLRSWRGGGQGSHPGG